MKFTNQHIEHTIRHDTVDCEVKRSITRQLCHFSSNIFREHHTAEWRFTKIHDIETQKVKTIDCSVFW